MIEHLQLAHRWDRHHTLYYRRWYKPGEVRNEWRNSLPMIVPMSIPEHKRLHRTTPPIAPPTEELAAYALHICDELEREEITRLDAFKTVQDKLNALHRKRPVSELGGEALRFVRFFDRQLNYMSENPVPEL